MEKIAGLEQNLLKSEQTNIQEQKRLNTEIERLNNILKATNHNLEEQVAKFTQKVLLLNKEIEDLRTQLQQSKKETIEEINRSEKAKNQAEIIR